VFGHGKAIALDVEPLLHRLREARQAAQAALQDAEQRAVQFMDAELRSRECAAEHRSKIHALNVEIDVLLDRMGVPKQREP